MEKLKFNLGAFILGFSLLVFPEMLAILLIIMGIFIFLSKCCWKISSIHSIVFFLLIWSAIHLFKHDFLKSLLVFLFFPVFILANIFVRFRKSIFFGIFASNIVFFGIYLLMIFFNFGFVGIKTIKGANQELNPNSQSTTVIPTGKDGVRVFMPLGFYGGVFEISIILRSKKTFNIMNAVYHDQITNRKVSFACQITTNWNKCTYRLETKRKGYLALALGSGWADWALDGSIFEYKNLEVRQIQRLSFREEILGSDRFRGNTFNPNAFGASIAIIGTYMIMIMPSTIWGLTSLVFVLLNVFASGSRESLIVFCVGLGAFLINHNKKIRRKVARYYFLPLILLSCFLFIFPSRNYEFYKTQLPRSVVFFDTDSIQMRVFIWKLSLNSWLNSQNGLFLGSKDFQKAMKIELTSFEPRSGINQKTVTHAHNIFFQVLGEDGILGLSLFCVIVFWSLFRSIVSKNYLSITSISTILILNFTDNLFFFAPIHIFFWISSFSVRFDDTIPQNQIRFSD